MSYVNPAGSTAVGDLCYTFSGTEATVVGVTSSSLASVTVPSTVTDNGTTYNVTAIVDGDYANKTGVFSAMTSLTSVTIQAGTVNIGDSAFLRCTNLASITLPEGVTRIGKGAFRETAVNPSSLPSTLVTIDTSAFYSTGLSLTALPDSVTTIGAFAFYGCSNLALTTLPPGVTSIAQETFRGCTSLALTELPSGLTSIGPYAFSGCTSLAHMELPSGLTSIATQAFLNCTALAHMELPSGLTSIGIGAFLNCTALETLSIPLATTTILSGPFEGCTNLTLSLDVSVTAEGDTDTVQWETGIDSSGNPTYVVTAPTSYNNRILTNWTYSGTDYNGGDSITMSLASRSITANLDPAYTGTCGDALTWILYADYSLGITGTGAMTDYAVGDPAPWDAYASSITSVSVPAGMTTIGQRAFNGCSALTAFTIPLTVTAIGLHAFAGCTNLVLSQEVSVTYEGNTTTETWTTSTDADGNPTYASTIPANPDPDTRYKWTYGGTTYKAGDTVTMSAADRAILKELITSFPLLVNGVQMSVVKILVKQNGTWTEASKTLVKQSGSWVEQ